MSNDNDNVSKYDDYVITQHKDGTVSLRLTKHAMQSLIEGAEQNEYSLYARFRLGEQTIEVNDEDRKAIAEDCYRDFKAIHHLWTKVSD